MSMSKSVTDDLWVCAAILPEQLKEEFANHNFRSFLHLCCSDEPAFVTLEQFQAAVPDAQMKHVPVKGRAPVLNKDSLHTLCREVDSMPKPVLVGCRSATRASLLAVAHQASRGRATLEDLAKNGEEKVRAAAGEAVMAEFAKDVPKGPTVECLFHNDTNTCTYVAWCPVTLEAAVIDCVADFDQPSGSVDFSHFKTVVEFVKQHGLKVVYIIETHAHADHISAAPRAKKVWPDAKVTIGKDIKVVQDVFSKVFNYDIPCDGSQFDLLVGEGDEIPLGKLKMRVIATPGHTPACVSYVVGDAVFTGDTLFMPDVGSARCDFPKGSSQMLWDSIQKLFALPGDTRNFVGHDYPPKGQRGPRWMCTIDEQRRENKQFRNGEVTREQWIEARDSRDATLKVPRYLLPSIQCNIRAGELPDPENNGTSYLKLPLKVQE